MDDLTRYRSTLEPVERDARDQPWADGRPWRVESHVWWESGVVVVDLHDLSAALARQAVILVLTRPSDAGAVVFVHGRGSHTLGASQVLRHVVTREIRKVCADHADWSWRPSGGGRTAWISDAQRAPASVTGAFGIGTWLLLLALAAAAVVGLLNGLGWL